MSTSLLYHGFGIRGPYYHVSTKFDDGEITFNIAHNPHMKCPACRSRNVIKQGTKHRRFHGTSIGTKPTYICINNQRVKCKDCHVIAYLPLRFVPKEKVRYTKGFEHYVLSLSASNMTISRIAQQCHVSWDCIKDIQKRALNKQFRIPCLKDVTHIGIDEIYCGSKTGFMTVVIDMKTSAVVYTEKGKKAASLDGFWARKKRCKQPIVAVATDMGQAYISSVKEHAPDARLVIDRFHVVKRFNDKLSDFRRDIQRQAEHESDAQFVKKNALAAAE